MKNVLLLKTGETTLSARLRVGDYDAWFKQAVAGTHWQLQVVRPYLGEPLPARVKDYAAVWTTGSPASVTELAPWMQTCADYLREAAQRGVPVLGVCFGHQLLAHAYGGRVARSPRGREIGTVDITLTPEGRKDPLFAGMPERVGFQATHGDMVEGLPPGITVLAGNTHTAVQAMAVGSHVRGVQFHPEVEPDAMRAMIEARAEGLEEEARAQGVPPGERVRGLLAGIRPLPYGRQLLLNFLRHWA
jgi:GMP synthase (glutamine-hydrolysing)